MDHNILRASGLNTYIRKRNHICSEIIARDLTVITKGTKIGEPDATKNVLIKLYQYISFASFFYKGLNKGFFKGFFKTLNKVPLCRWPRATTCTTNKTFMNVLATSSRLFRGKFFKLEITFINTST